MNITYCEADPQNKKSVWQIHKTTYISTYPLAFVLVLCRNEYIPFKAKGTKEWVQRAYELETGQDYKVLMDFFTVHRIRFYKCSLS